MRLADTRRAEAAWAQLAGLGAAARPGRFDPAVVDGLPGPARRWLLRAVADIEMEGEFGLGDRDAPRY